MKKTISEEKQLQQKNFLELDDHYTSGAQRSGNVVRYAKSNEKLPGKLFQRRNTVYVRSKQSSLRENQKSGDSG